MKARVISGSALSSYRRLAPMNPSLQQIPEWHGVDDAVFRNDIIIAYRPAVLRGIARHWPAVHRAIESTCRYLNAFDSGKPVDVLLAPPHVKGRIFYNDEMTGFNFTRERQSISAVNDKLLRYSAFQNWPSLAVQSALIADCLPGFAEQNRLAKQLKAFVTQQLQR